MKYLLSHTVEDSWEAHRDEVALDQEGRTVRYGELEVLSRRVATMLRRIAATCPDRVWYVGVTSSVTVESIAAVLGILRAGFAYVPLDVHSPPARLSAILRDAGVPILLVDPLAYPAWTSLVSPDVKRHIVLLGSDEAPQLVTGDAEVVPWSAVLAGESEPLAPPPTVADDLAYVLYTSGSTGVPKGVMLSHRNAKTFVDWMAKEFRIRSDDVVMSRAPLNYDLSVFDVFNTLAAGATLVIKDLRPGTTAGQPAEVRHRAYVDLMRAKRATVLYSTPSTFVALMEKGQLDERVPLRLMMYAGELFPVPQLREFMARMPATRVANIYGPTETNIVTYYWVKEPPADDGPVPIGREVDDTHILVVDGEGRVCPVEQPGEFWVRGGTVCSGYLGKPELSQACLVKSPVHPYPAVYWRTGDYGVRRSDGNLVHHGRIDAMVKSRGHRVELGEVEAALAGLDEVRQAVVVPRKHDRYGNTLHAYVMLKEGRGLSEQEILGRVASRLPSYMMPADLRLCASFPYTSTGKVDRQALRRALEAEAWAGASGGAS